MKLSEFTDLIIPLGSSALALLSVYESGLAKESKYR